MTASRRARRAAGLAGLLGTAGLLVAGKAALAPAVHRVALAGPAGAPAPISTGPPAPTPAVTASPGTATASRAAAHTAAPAPATTVRTTAAPAPVVRTVLGAAEGNPYGTVQVRLTLDGTRITDVTAVQLPSGGRSSEISAYAAPQLRSEVLAAQSAGIDTVSGASYTSEGYARSLQAALDAARK